MYLYAGSSKHQANVAFRNGKYEVAVQMYTKALAEDSSSHTLWSNRAASYHLLGQYEKALADSDECVRLRPRWIKVKHCHAHDWLLVITPLKFDRNAK